MVTDVNRRGETMTRIINVYDQKDVQTGERRARKLNWHRAIRQGGGTIIAGDMNAHSRRWDPRCWEQHDATFWEEILDEYGLEIGNDDRPTHHWARNGEEGESTIDLTLATRLITRWTTLDRSHATGSDHEVIEWEFNVDEQEEADHMQVIGWNLAAVSKEDEEAADKLRRELEIERAHLGEECTGDNVDRAAEWCQDALSQVLDAKAKKIGICARSKRWWNGEIKETRSALGREKRRGRRSEAAARAKAELQKSIRQSKSWMLNDYVHNHRGGEV
jgi:macrodomain Ter protein organizer (MatP/YcbG family)